MKFITVANRELAEELLSLGFQYIKNAELFSFPYCAELIEVLNSRFSEEPYVCDNKLRF